MEQVQTAGRSRGLQSPECSPASAWHSQPSRPTTPTAPLMSQEMRQAMTSWTNRPSLLTAAPRRQAEESSNGSISQEVVMEEVRRQVKAALDERESEMKRLHDENQELRQVVMALADRELGVEGGGQSSGALMDGDMGLRGSEPRGNPATLLLDFQHNLPYLVVNSLAEDLLGHLRACSGGPEERQVVT
ncbi:ATG18, partial [Symbiodinium sp. CCMP2456]